MPQATRKVSPERDEGDDSPSTRKRVLRVDQIWSKKDRKEYLYKTRKAWVKKDRSDKWCLVVRRIINNLGMVDKTQIEIRSQRLAEVMAKIFEGVRGLDLSASPPTLSRNMFFHAHTSLMARYLEEKAKDRPDQALIDDIIVALDFHVEEYASDIGSLDSLLEKGEISYNLLWAIFKPNGLTFTEANALHEPQVLTLYTLYKRIETETKKEMLEIVTREINHDGEALGWGTEAFRIPEFQGSKKISSLTIYPLEHHSDPERLRKSMLEQGNKYFSLLEPTCRMYDGLATYPVYEGSKWVVKRFNATGRIMIDPIAFRMKDPDSILTEPSVDTAVNSKLLDDKGKICTHHRILGFSFQQKRWGAFAVSRISDVMWNQGAFERVIMPQKKHAIIRTLVESHLGKVNTFSDIISGKGKGLVGLFTGGPGVGKSLTAEAVAELCKRPLYTITSADLGTDASEVDENLEMVLEFTRRWGCVLLIDEADVFLQKRNTTQLNVNALVSVFLRHLEYCQGIVILTTNRDQDIDEAFKSRIHFRFDYPPLNKESRFKIWSNFLSTIPDYLGGDTFSKNDLWDLASLPLNGREIRNTISCAVSIIQSTNESWTIDFIKDVIGTLVGDRVLAATVITND